MFRDTFGTLHASCLWETAIMIERLTLSPDHGCCALAPYDYCRHLLMRQMKISRSSSRFRSADRAVGYMPDITSRIAGTQSLSRSCTRKS